MEYSSVWHRRRMFRTETILEFPDHAARGLYVLELDRNPVEIKCKYLQFEQRQTLGNF